MPGSTRPAVTNPRARAAAPRSNSPQDSAPTSVRSSASSRTSSPAHGRRGGLFHQSRVGARRGAPSARWTSSVPRAPRASTSRVATRPSSTTGCPVGNGSEVAARAASDESGERVAEEAADVLYHLAVLLASRDLALTDAYEVLNGRRR